MKLATGKSVALKLLHAREGSESSTGSEADRFHRETQIGATLSHTNIVELIDSGVGAIAQAIHHWRAVAIGDRAVSWPAAPWRLGRTKRATCTP